MTLVIDASVLVSALVDDGPHGRWATELLMSAPLAAPQILPVETANVLRRAIVANQLSDEMGSLAHADMIGLRVALFDYEAVSDRIWELRHTVTPYDAWYVAVAELLDAPLATLDARLARAPGPRCRMLTPPAGT